MSVVCSTINSKGKRCKNKSLKNEKCWVHLKMKDGLRIKQSNIANGGLGLFATKDFKKNDIVAPYSGPIISEAKADQEKSSNKYLLQITKNKVIDASSPVKSGAGRYANQCKAENKRKEECKCNNAKLVKSRDYSKAQLKANKTIKNGQEIFTNYGRDYWKNKI